MIDEDTALKLKDIEARLHEANNDGKKKYNTGKGAAASGVNFGFRLVTELIGGVVIGGGLGCFFDSIFSTDPILFIIFLLFGGAAGVLNSYRMVKKREEKKLNQGQQNVRTD